MKVSLKWLQDYVEITLPLSELAERLTMSGTEVGSIQTIGQNWQDIVIGQVVALDPHPNADRLKLATVDLGRERPTVVCGAPNVSVSDKVAFAKEGAQLIDPGNGQLFRLKAARIRGVVSKGMVCSEKELGISEDHTGILILPQDAPVGLPLADYLGDTILDVEVTPNRPDCLSMLGIACEIAALTEQTIKPPSLEYPEPGPAIEQMASVEIADPDLCYRYCASLINGVKIKDSPRWMQQKLLAYGMRPINNIVDITNFVMLEYGQPLHAFDFRQLRKGKIIVRRARQGEVMTTLDGAERPLAPHMLAIADADVPVALAGVMGSAESEVTPGTTTILLESANFNAQSIRRTSTELKMRSEASLRFERGLNPDLTVPALRRATQLMVELGGGQAASGILDVYPDRKELQSISLPLSEIKRLLGIDLDREKVVKVLTDLGFSCQNRDTELLVSSPYWRSDIKQKDDLVEEVARIIGYDHIPTTILSGSPPPQSPNPLLDLKDEVRDILVACGFQEVITYSIVSPQSLNKTGVVTEPLRLANPLNAGQDCLRTSLRPTLLSTLAANLRYQDQSIKLFEVGRIYLPQEKDLPQEQEMVAGLMCGSRNEPSWLGDGGESDFFDAKGVVETLLARLGMAVRFESIDDPALHPGRCAAITASGELLGVVGQLQPAMAEAFELGRFPVYLFEFDLEKLLALIPGQRRYQPLPRFPAVMRDLALVVDVSLPHERIEQILKISPLVSRVTLFDLYSGEQVPAGKKSLAYHLIYQSPEHTLTDAEVDQAQQRLLEELRFELGVTLRA